MLCACVRNVQHCSSKHQIPFHSADKSIHRERMYVQNMPLDLASHFHETVLQMYS